MYDFLKKKYVKNLLSYFYAILAVPLIVILRFALLPIIGPGIPYITLFPVSVAVALLAGLGPAILTGILGSIAIDYFFIPPFNAVDFDAVGISRIVIVTLTSAFVGYVGEKLRNARSVAEKQAIVLRESESRLELALDAAKQAAWENDLITGKIIASPKMKGLYGINDDGSRLHSQDFWRAFVIEEDLPVLINVVDNAIAGNNSYGVEYRIRRESDGAVRWIESHGQILRDSDGKPVRNVGVLRDITERKQMEDEVRKSRDELEVRVRERTKELSEEVIERKKVEQALAIEYQRFNDVLELLPVYVVLLTLDYHVPFANKFFRDRFGESGGKRCFEYLFGKNEPCEICETYKVLKTGKQHRWQWIGPDGRNYDIFDFPFTDKDGSPLIMEMGIDITEQKRATEALNQLTKRIVEVQEQERQRVARELHDEICQHLSATKMQVDVLEGQVPKSNKNFLKKLRLVRRQLGKSINEVRRISANLRPSALDDLGFVTAMRVLCSEFEKDNSVKVRFVARGVTARLDNENIEIALYRITQEALTNILKYADATEVMVTILYHENLLSLIVKDDGRGFDVTKQARRKDHTGLGLMSIQQRVQLIGGNVIITSTRGEGTIVRVDVPYKKGSDHEKN